MHSRPHTLPRPRATHSHRPRQVRAGGVAQAQEIHYGTV